MTAIECHAVQTAQEGDSVLISLGCIPASMMAYARIAPDEAMQLAARLTAAAHAASDVRDQAQAGGDAA